MTLASMTGSHSMPTTNDLAIDLVEVGAWLWKQHKFRPKYQLRSLTNTAIELLGDRHKQYNLRPDYLLGMEDTLSALAKVDRQRMSIAGLQFVRSRRVSNWWINPTEIAHLCARSAIVSVLRHFTGSPSDLSSGLHEIHVAELGLGMDGLLYTLNQTGDVEAFQQFAVSWSQDIAEHERFLMRGALSTGSANGA